MPNSFQKTSVFADRLSVHTQLEDTAVTAWRWKPNIATIAERTQSSWGELDCEKLRALHRDSELGRHQRRCAQ